MLGIHPFVAEMAMQAAAVTPLPDLEAIYRRLLEVDIELKTSQVEPDTALDLFVANWCSSR